MATVCGLLAFLGLVLVPPARCLFALSVPTLGTEQGRRLLLSWSTATLTIAVVPNILANLRATGQVLRCVTEGSLESLLNTTHWLQTASQALNPDGQAGSQGLTLQAQGDSAAAFRLHVLRVTQQVLEDFSGLESSARVVALGTQRMSWLMVCEGTSSRMQPPFRVGAMQPFGSAAPAMQGSASLQPFCHFLA